MEESNVKAIREALSDACYAMFNFLKTQNSGFEEMAKAWIKQKLPSPSHRATAMSERRRSRSNGIRDCAKA